MAAVASSKSEAPAIGRPVRSDTSVWKLKRDSSSILETNKKLPFVNALSKATGAEAKKIGKQIPGLDTKAWDENSSEIMKKILREKF